MSADSATVLINLPDRISLSGIFRLRVIFSVSFADCVKSFSCSEKQRHTPYTRECDEGIYYAASECVLTAEYPRDRVELEYSYTAPIKSAHNGEDQGNSIHQHFSNPPFERIYPFKISFYIIMIFKSDSFWKIKKINKLLILSVI